MSGFVMVPAWLRRKKPTANAMLTYVTLASFGKFDPETGRYEECRPAVATLAEESGLTLSVVKRALVELYGLGAVERRSVLEVGKGKRPSIYRVIFGTLEGPPPAVTLADMSDSPGAGYAHGPGAGYGDGPPVGHGITSQNATDGPLTGHAMAQTDGPLTGHEEEVTLTHNPETKKNTTSRERSAATDRDPLTSPAFLIDTPGPVGVLSGHTQQQTSGDVARLHYGETKRITEDIMINYATWFARETGETLSPTEERKIRTVVSGLVNERNPNDDLTRLRNSIASGLGNWTRSNSFSAKQIPDFVLLAKRAVVAAPPPSKVAEKAKRTAETFAWAAGKSPEQMAASLEQQLMATRPAAFGPAPSIARVTAAIEGGWSE